MADNHMRRACWWAIVLATAAPAAAVAQVVATDTPIPSPVTHPVEVSDPRAAALAARRVRVDVRDVPLEAALDVIATQARLKLMYARTVLTGAPRVTMRVVDVPVADAFRRALRGTDLEAVIGPGGQVSLARHAGASRAQITGTITGRVTDSANGQGLSGATVRVQGTTLSAVTHDNGAFTLADVPIGEQVLTVRSFGHRPVVRPVTVMEQGHTTVQVVMSPVATVLSGVVTTATGVQQKREVGNDIVTLNVDSLKQVAPITSVTDLLESRVPGLTVLRASGAPGDPARLRLRGSKSITGSNDPIVIIDGVRVYAAQSDRRTANLAGSAVQGTSPFSLGNKADMQYAAPSPLDQLDPNGIETIEVLKGPSASSLYGSDAANGVIVITTKKGRAGPTRWSTTLAQGTSALPGRYPIQTVRWGHSPYQGAASQSQPCPITAISDCSVFDSVTHIQVLNESRWSPFGHGGSSSGSATVSGGSSALTYALTGSAATELGYLKLPAAMAEQFRQFHGYEVPGWAKRPSQYVNWGGGGQLTVLPTPGATLTFQSNLFHSRQQRSSLEQQLPGLLGALDTVCGSGLAATTCENQVLASRNAYERATSEQLTMTNALSGSWVPWAWLPLTATAGLSTSTGHDVALLARDIVPSFPSAGSSTADMLGRYGVAAKSATQKTLTVNTTIPSWRGRLKTALGLNVYSQSSSDVAAQTDSAGLALGVSTPSALGGRATQFTTGTSTYGWFFEPRLMLSERFFLTPGFRLDGGNANGQGARVSGLPTKLTFAALFPKVNFSWVALDRQNGERPFFGVLTLLRPRLALGSAGVQPSPGDQLRLSTTDRNLFPDLAALGGTDLLVLQKLGNTQLRPERSTEVEGGFEAELWRGRVTLDLTHATQLRRDAIIPVPVAASVDGPNRTLSLNIGEIRNTSTELSGTIRPVETPLLTWSVGGSYAKNDNRVLKLDRSSVALLQGENGQTKHFTNATSVDVHGTKIAVGYPLFGRWEKPIVSYYDVNQNDVIEANEITYGDTSVYLGRQEPAYTAALNTDLTLFRGRLGVHANLSRQGGYSQLNGAARGGTFLSGANEPGAPLGEQASYVAAIAGNYYGLVQTVSSWRFQSLSVNYNAPASLARRFRSQRLSLALQGENLGLWTNYRGKDPNVNGYANGNLTADLGQLAQPRTWRLQLTLGN